MDPDTALAIVNDNSFPLDERDDAAEALSGWLASGGYAPSGELTVSAASRYPRLYDTLRHRQARAW